VYDFRSTSRPGVGTGIKRVSCNEGKNQLIAQFNRHPDGGLRILCLSPDIHLSWA
jgi:hypothetical protein